MSEFIPPMLASPMPEQFFPKPGEWCLEEKFDGHRLFVRVVDGHVSAWSRNALPRILPSHIRESLEKFPDCALDGELLVPGRRSYGVTELTNSDKLVYVVFDVIELKDTDLVKIRATYMERRFVLEELFEALKFEIGSWTNFDGVSKIGHGRVRVADSYRIELREDIDTAAKQVWARDGEGLILKRRTSIYVPDKRSKDWLKIKQLRSAVLTVVGFQRGKMGPASVIVLRDDDGNETSVKWKNLELLGRVQRDPGSFLKRRVRIEYQERTPDGGYRHPRWDRFAEEGE